MSEQIVRIAEYRGTHPCGYGYEAGFQVVTTDQTITLAIADDSCCCETWGYFLTEDDTRKFVGAELRGVAVTDWNRSGRKFVRGWSEDYNEERGDVTLDEGDVMFVDIETDRGVLQFVAYNAHNGYYGHDARVSARQLEHSASL